MSQVSEICNLHAHYPKIMFLYVMQFVLGEEY